jgi:hypothetical protein
MCGATPEPSDDLAGKVIAAVTGMNQAALDALMAAAATVPEEKEQINQYVTAALITGGHDVQRFWLNRCTCHDDGPPQTLLAAARPITPNAELLRIVKESGQTLPNKYPGSVVMPCTRCNEPCWVGPRIQRALKANPMMILVCYLCASKDPQIDDTTPIHDLGNSQGQS